MLGRFSSAAVRPLNPAERGDGTGGNKRAQQKSLTIEKVKRSGGEMLFLVELDCS